jgi:glucose/arabinose dehydrogenase
MIFAATLLALACPQNPTEPVESDYYTIDYFTPPEGEVVEVGGLDFMPNGDALVSTRRGRVWWVENASAADPADAIWHLFAEGLHEGLGLHIDDERIYVVQRSELSELVDLDGDYRCDVVRTISQDWGMTGNYHEFVFGLPRDQQGNFYISLNVGFWSPEWWHGISKAPYRGWIMRISPDGSATPWASGVRSPCGLGMNSAGDLFYTDNQGDWMAVCPIFHVRQGDFFGHPASLRWTEEYLAEGRIPNSTDPPEVKRTPAAVLIPYAWSRSAGNLVEDQTSGKFGPYEGQMFVAELTNGTVVRTQMEKVRGEYQGAVFKFRDEIGSVCRVAFAPDGSLFTGFTNRGWGGRAPGHGLARIRWTGDTPFDMHSVHLVKGGFEIDLTKALAADFDATSLGIEAESYDYNYWWDYGSPQQRFEPMAIRSSEISADRKTLKVYLDNLQPARCVRLTLKALRDEAGAPLLHDSFHYTVNQLVDGPLTEENIIRQVAPPAEKPAEAEGWLNLSWGDALDRFESEGWELVDVELDPKDPSKLITRPGMGALVNSGDQPSDFVSKQEFGDVEFHFRFMLPKNGDSGLYFMERYELQLVDRADQCCGVIGGKGPRVTTAYKGAGVWHTVGGRFYAPRFDESGRKIRNATFEQITLDGSMIIGSTEVAKVTPGGQTGELSRAPFFFQGSAGKACIGDIRIKPLDSALDAANLSVGKISAVSGSEKPVYTSTDWYDLFARGIEGWNSSGDAQWALADGLLQAKGGSGRLTLPKVGPEFWELQGQIQLQEGGQAALVFHADENGAGERALLDCTPSSRLKTGSVLGASSSNKVSAELVPGGVWFDFDLRLLPDGWLHLYLNGVEISRLEMSAASPSNRHFALELGTGADLKIRGLKLRAWAKAN